MKKALSLAALILLGACASPPPPVAPSLDPAIEEQFASTSVESIELNDQWWTEFEGDALDPLIREALTANYDLRAATANVQAAQAAAKIAGAGRLPQINAGLNSARSEQALIGLPIGGGGVLKTLSTSHRASLEASWEIDLWNRLGLKQRAALAELQASEADLAAVRLSLAGQVTKSWLDLTEAELQLALAVRTRDAFEQTAITAQSRYERGLIPSVDVHLTRTSFENASALLAMREGLRESASRRLELLLGRYPQGKVAVEAELPQTQALAPAGLPADLLLRRPDLLALERRLVASQSRTGEAERNLLPRITLTGSAGYTSNELGDLLEGNFSVWSIAGSLLQPVFQGGRLRAQVSQSAAMEDAALARWAQRALIAMSEVETALSQERWLAEREVHLRNAADSATAASELAESRYQQGLGNLLAVLEAQRRALDSESQWLSIRNARLQTRVNLHLALGGGFDPQAGKSTQFLADLETPTSDSGSK